MSDDIVKRLRAVERSGGIHYALAGNCADEIERLRAELAAERERSGAWLNATADEKLKNAKLREALVKAQKALANSQDWIDADEDMQTHFPNEWSVVDSANKEAIAAIDAVLKETGGDSE